MIHFVSYINPKHGFVSSLKFSHNIGWGSRMSRDYDNIKQDLEIINCYCFIRQFWIGRARYEYDQVDMRLWRSSTAARRCLASSTSSPSRLGSGSRATSPSRRTWSSPTCQRVASRRSRPFLPPDGSRSWSWCFDVVLNYGCMIYWLKLITAVVK